MKKNGNIIVTVLNSVSFLSRGGEFVTTPFGA